MTDDKQPIKGAAFTAALAFRRMADGCEYRHANDCCEPSQDFLHLSCSPELCPLLWVALNEVEGRKNAKRRRVIRRITGN